MEIPHTHDNRPMNKVKQADWLTIKT